MASPDKSALLVAYLATKGIDVDESRYGNVQVRCFNEEGHPNGDRNPSLSVKIQEGVVHCFSCPMRGDVYRLIELERGVSFREAERIAQSIAPGVGGAVPPVDRRRESGLPGGKRAWRPKHGRQVSPWSSGRAGQRS